MCQILTSQLGQLQGTLEQIQAEQQQQFMQFSLEGNKAINYLETRNREQRAQLTQMHDELANAKVLYNRQFKLALIIWSPENYRTESG